MKNLDKVDNVDEINLRDIFSVFWQGKRQIASTTILFFVISILYSLFLPNIFRSEAILATSQKENSLMDSASLSSLASIAGFNLADSANSESDKAITIMMSTSFFEDKIFPNIHLPNLIADPRWDSKTNTLSYDSNLYDRERGQWVGGSSNSQDAIPTVQEAHRYFLNNVLNIKMDNLSGFVTLSIDHASPFIAKKWAELIINQINDHFRERDLELALSSIIYLNEQIAMTSVVEVRQALSQLLKNQIKVSMLTDANKEYVFVELDPPIAPEKKHSPNRKTIVLIGTFLGFFVASLIIFIRNFAWRDYK
ncbi:MAG: hypothetical protein CBB97_06770 [Candidatus Endolissoclinum sp. TMED37]|nr:MAG: hypothetical protein CBB97_06770 [Candidatus Endolissoclinum sp. TMED37]